MGLKLIFITERKIIKVFNWNYNVKLDTRWKNVFIKVICKIYVRFNLTTIFIKKPFFYALLDLFCVMHHFAVVNASVKYYISILSPFFIFRMLVVALDDKGCDFGIYKSYTRMIRKVCLFIYLFWGNKLSLCIVRTTIIMVDMSKKIIALKIYISRQIKNATS